MARREGDFPTHVYHELFSRAVCEECGCGPDPEDPFHIHHIIWLEWGKNHGIPLEVLRSVANARLIHKSCHDHLHNIYDEPPQEDIDFVLSQVAIQISLF